MKNWFYVLLLAPLTLVAGTIGEGLNCTSLTWTTGGTPSFTGENVDWSYTTDDSYSDGAWDVGDAELLGDFLPWEAGFTGGVRWTFPRAGSVRWNRDEEMWEDSRAESGNPAGLKLSYQVKAGSFKGSFKVYADDGGRLRKWTANVTGVMVGDVGYESAIVKGLGSQPISIVP